MSVLHQYSPRNCCSGRKRAQKTDSVSQVWDFSLFCLFFPWSLLPSPPPVCSLSLILHHTPTHTCTQWASGSPFSSLSVAHHFPTTPISPVSPTLVISHLPYLFFLHLASLHSFLSFSFISLSPFPLSPWLKCGCKRRLSDLTLGLFTTSVHSCWRPCWVLWGRGLLIVECGSLANMCIQNTNLELNSKAWGLGEVVGGKVLGGVDRDRGERKVQNYPFFYPFSHSTSRSSLSFSHLPFLLALPPLPHHASMHT